MTTAHQTIAEQVGTFQAGLAEHIPAEVAAAFAADLRRTVDAGLPDVLAVGSPFPTAELLDAHGAATTIAATAAGRPAVVVFYRGAWCPYCNIALRAYQEQLAGPLDERGVALIAVSPQKADGSLSMEEKNELSFAVLSDPGNQLATGLGILTAPGAEAIAAQAQLGVDLTEANADATHTIPMPTVALVDGGGTLRWIDVHPDFTTRTEAADVLAAVDASS